MLFCGVATTRLHHSNHEATKYARRITSRSCGLFLSSFGRVTDGTPRSSAPSFGGSIQVSRNVLSRRFGRQRTHLPTLGSSSWFARCSFCMSSHRGDGSIGGKDTAAKSAASALNIAQQRIAGIVIEAAIRFKNLLEPRSGPVQPDLHRFKRDSQDLRNLAFFMPSVSLSTGPSDSSPVVGPPGLGRTRSSGCGWLDPPIEEDRSSIARHLRRPHRVRPDRQRRLSLCMPGDRELGPSRHLSRRDRPRSIRRIRP